MFRCRWAGNQGSREAEDAETIVNMSSSKGVYSQGKIVTDRLFVCGIRRKMLLKSPRVCRRRQTGPQAPPSSP